MTLVRYYKKEDIELLSCKIEFSINKKTNTSTLLDSIILILWQIEVYIYDSISLFNISANI